MEPKNFNLEKFEEAVLKKEATWWQMELPSGKVIFGDTKPEMLGYKPDNFKKYQDFTNLLHPDDYDKAMQAMKNHLEGKSEVYETLYKIKNSDGEYITFYDCGQITKKEGENITVMGFVMKVKEDANTLKQMEDFKNLIIKGNPSIIKLVEKSQE